MPENIVPSDEHIFAKALTHYFKTPSINVFNYVLWSPFKNGELISGFIRNIRFCISTLLLQKKIKAISKAVWVTDKYSSNYFHWINDVLPKLVLLEQRGIKAAVLLPKNLSNSKFILGSLELMGWDHIIVERENLLLVKKLFVPDHTAGSGNQNPIYFREVVLKLSKTTKSNKNRRIFITRRNSSTRNIVPLDPFENLLKSKGIEIVEAESLTFIEQKNLFSECSHLIGVHGAGLTNMIFMQPKSKVLEIRRNDDQHNYCYFSMANIINIRYYYFLAGSANASTVVQEDNFIVDLKRIEVLIDSFID